MTSVACSPASLTVLNDDNHTAHPFDQPHKRGRRPAAARDPAFAANLKRLRRRDGYTQKQLDEALDEPQGTVAKWERNLSVPSHAQLKAVAALFTVTVDELLDNDPSSTFVAQGPSSNLSSGEWRRFILDLLAQYPGRVEINFWAANQTATIHNDPSKSEV